MTQRTEIADAVEMLVDARKRGAPRGPLPEDLRPQSSEEGYAIQMALTEALGETPAGWKVAATNAAAQTKMGTDEPFAGPLFSSMLAPSPHSLHCSEFNVRIIEGEFAYRLGKNMPCRDEPYSMEEVADAVACVHPAIEIADTRFENFLGVGVPSLIADGAISGAFVFAPGITDWRSLDLSRWSVKMSANGNTVGEGTGASAMGDPLVSLHWLINKLVALGIGARADQLVTTGSCTGNYLAQPGDVLVADFGELGTVSVEFDNS